MYTTELELEESLFKALSQNAQRLNLSFSSYISEILSKELENKNNPQSQVTFADFAGMWQDSNISLESIRSKAWK